MVSVNSRSAKNRIYGRIRTVLIAGILAMAVVFISGTYIVNSFIPAYIKKQLNRIFPQCDVKFKSEYVLWDGYRLEGLSINAQNNSYMIGAKEVRLSGILGLVTNKGAHATVTDLSIDIKTDPVKLFDSIKQSESGKKPVYLSSISLVNASMTVDTKDIELKSRLNCDIQPLYMSISNAELVVDTFRMGETVVNGLRINMKDMALPGTVEARELKYKKFQVEKVKAGIAAGPDGLMMSDIDSAFLDGRVKGRAVIGRDMSYDAGLVFVNTDIERFVSAVEADKKIAMSGRMNGEFFIQGKGQKLKNLKGDFMVDQKGGMLIIKDDEMLDRMAQNSKQSVDLVMESFKNYHYNKGRLKVYLDDDNIVLDASLDGEAGKRELSVVFHDLSINQPSPGLARVQEGINKEDK